MKTAQEVANELDLTRTEVYNLLRKKRFSQLVKKNGGQVAISNELFRLLEEEIKSKRNNIKQQEDKLLAKKNTITNVKIEKSPDFNTIEVLQNQVKLKDNQIIILNNVIDNNLKRIKDLEEKNHEFRELHEELNNLKLVIDSIQTKKKKKRLLGVF
ncbi:DNA-binding protein (plasmid) [Clostridium perfringens]|uniref:DNA-binding protein n=1 Tax=Clostridium perfringens TaxID=1502 RepID=UPI0030D52D7D